MLSGETIRERSLNNWRLRKRRRKGKEREVSKGWERIY